MGLWFVLFAWTCNTKNLGVFRKMAFSKSEVKERKIERKKSKVRTKKKIIINKYINILAEFVQRIWKYKFKTLLKFNKERKK